MFCFEIPIPSCLLPGPDRSGVLATISLSPQAKGESDFHLQNVQVTNTVSEAIPVELQDGHVTVLECIFGDLDCDVDVVDMMQVASRWRCRSEDGCYVENYDTDKGGDIDIMKVVAHWGETCP